MTGLLRLLRTTVTISARCFCFVTLLALPCSNVWAQEKIRVGVGVTSEFLTFFMAADHDLFAKQGLVVEPVPMAGSASSNQIAALLSGSISILANSAPTLIQSADSGLPVVAISNGSVLPTSGNLGIVARKGSGIVKPGDLAGKRVAVSGLNSITHFAARNWLKENGVDDKSIKWVEVLAPQMIDMMKSAQFDAAVMFDPFSSVAREQGVGDDLGQIYERTPAGTSLAVYIATTDWAKRNSSQLAKFRAALAEGMALANSNRPAATESLAKNTKLPPQALKLIGMPNLQTKLSAENLSWWVKVLDDQGVLTTKVAPDKLIAP